ncbi:Radical SAM domain protein [Denitrovibrio acetiphilus DSM 12809]|uniref:Radical SAM domain protein n=1 Tax=Denitrovibrio acetiphilus (strain DSM 12809 / NBRC 114555 / N2460) TaxID=522772 RepID=D4H4S6_DENA2|nr:radical SAM protein [Denitrovibrio acetiphilus]ADD67470.1 Radical SAM domain protein [Denitrovibrio acetiphilus DSM 12809]
MNYIDFLSHHTTRKSALLNILNSFSLPVGEDENTEYSGLISILNENPLVKICNAGKSIRYNYVSEACELCHKGDRSHTFITSLECSRYCYYCANLNQEESVFLPLKEQYDAREDRQMLQSVGITGGEPFLFKKEVTGFVGYVKEDNPDCYIRIYTCGDYLDSTLLQELQMLGLDEIRISVKPDDAVSTALDKISLCAEYIPHVVVEMPVFPDEEEYMQNLLISLQDTGAAGINLLEFLFPLNNEQVFAEKGYRLKHTPYHVIYNYDYPGGLPIAGSELLALRLIEFAAGEKLNIGVHYCALENKFTSQIYFQNSRIKLRNWEIMDPNDFFIKTLRVKIDGTDIISELGLKENDYFKGSDYVDIHPMFREKTGAIEMTLVYSVAENIENKTVIREVHYGALKGVSHELQ